MEPTVRGAPARRALFFGLAAGAWLVLSASTAGAQAVLPAGGAAAAAGPERIHLAQAGAAPTERPVTYSAEQADRGEERYASECEECHGGDLRGGLIGGAPLRGVSFEQKFANGAPVSALYMYTSSLMPPNAPGRFSASTYADLVAYILKRNGFRAGAPLPTDVEELDYLMMEK